MRQARGAIAGTVAKYATAIMLGEANNTGRVRWKDTVQFVEVDEAVTGGTSEKWQDGSLVRIQFTPYRLVSNVHQRLRSLATSHVSSIPWRTSLEARVQHNLTKQMTSDPTYRTDVVWVVGGGDYCFPAHQPVNLREDALEGRVHAARVQRRSLRYTTREGQKRKKQKKRGKKKKEHGRQHGGEARRGDTRGGRRGEMR